MQTQTQGFTAPFFSSVSGKMERRFVVSEDERRFWTRSIGKPAPFGFGWTPEHAEAQLNTVLEQVWHVYNQAADTVSPSEVWSLFQMVLVNALASSASGRAQYDPAMPLAPWVSRCSRGLLANRVAALAPA